MFEADGFLQTICVNSASDWESMVEILTEQFDDIVDGDWGDFLVESELISVAARFDQFPPVPPTVPPEAPPLSQR